MLGIHHRLQTRLWRGAEYPFLLQSIRPPFPFVLSMDIVCNYPLPSDLFAQSIHPSEPVISVGLATGHVRTFRLPSTHLEPAPPVTGNGSSTHAGSRRLSSSSVNGCATIETQWQTRRHKGSCRALIFSADGTKLFSTGMDGLVKIASAETGAVQTKLIVNAGQYALRRLFNCEL